MPSGARIASGGERLGATTYAPTVLVEHASNAKVSREVVFGPVTCVYAHRELAQAIARANDLPLASQAGVFTNDLQMALRAAERLEASTVLVNDHTAFQLGHVRRAQAVRLRRRHRPDQASAD